MFLNQLNKTIEQDLEKRLYFKCNFVIFFVLSSIEPYICLSLSSPEGIGVQSGNFLSCGFTLVPIIAGLFGLECCLLIF